MANHGSETARLLDSIQPGSFSTDAERYEAKEAARRLLARLETPFERAWVLTMENSVLLPAIQVCQDLGIWSKWAGIHKTNGSAQTLDDIVKMCNTPAEPNLLRRFLRHLAALNVLEETGLDEWKPTPLALAMGDESTYTDQLLQFGMYQYYPCGVNLPRFLAKNQYQEPLDTSRLDNHADTFGDHFFDHCRDDPATGASFIGMMAAVRNYKMDWTEVYDTKAQLLDGAELATTTDTDTDTDTTGPAPPPFFVDVGGAHGHDTARLLARHPDLPPGAGLVVQDLPEVTSTHGGARGARLDERITRAAYDFFTPQPLVGARAYFMHAVPHDWPDEDCVRIFENVRAAMRRGYSRLLVYEIVLPARGAGSMMTALDLQLMSLLSGLERTEEDWRRLLGRVGLRVVKIWRHPRALESVIEAELA